MRRKPVAVTLQKPIKVFQMIWIYSAIADASETKDPSRVLFISYRFSLSISVLKQMQRSCSPGMVWIYPDETSKGSQSGQRTGCGGPPLVYPMFSGQVVESAGAKQIRFHTLITTKPCQNNMGAMELPCDLPGMDQRGRPKRMQVSFFMGQRGALHPGLNGHTGRFA